MRIGPAHSAMFQKMDKETLCQVLRIRLREAQAPKVCKDRCPIVIAKGGKRVVAFGYRFSRGAHLAPARRRKIRSHTPNTLRHGKILRRRMTSTRHSFSREP